MTEPNGISSIRIETEAGIYEDFASSLTAAEISERIEDALRVEGSFVLLDRPSGGVYATRPGRIVSFSQAPERSATP